jgi:acetoin utilization protein AcuB
MTRHTVARYMSARSVTIASRRTLAEAHEIMRDHGVRHLPVVDDGRLVGLVSQRDLYLLETLRGVDAGRETVAEAMTREPFAVHPDAPVDEVAREMADRKYGCAVVADGSGLVGVFTTVDALRALAAVLRPGRAPARGAQGVRDA